MQKKGDKFYKFHFVLGIGGNIKNPKFRFKKFMRMLINDKRFFVSATSPLLVNKAFGFKAQDDFYNAVAIISTNFNANESLKILQHYEKIFGRKRSFKNAPRTLDLDILYFSERVRKSARLILPHPGVNERVSVFLPLGMI